MCKIVHCGRGGSGLAGPLLAAVVIVAGAAVVLDVLASLVTALNLLLPVLLTLGVVAIVAASAVWLLRALLEQRADQRESAAVLASLATRGITPAPRPALPAGVRVTATPRAQLDQWPAVELVDLDEVLR